MAPPISILAIRCTNLRPGHLEGPQVLVPGNLLKSHLGNLGPSLGFARVPRRGSKINERIRMELRADATNLTNSVYFLAPTADISSSIFGRINNSVASSSRKIQLGLKVQF